MNNFIVPWWQSVPLGTKGVMILDLLIWLIHLIFGQAFYDIWTLDPSTFIGSLAFWRLFTTQFVQGGLIGLLVNSTACFDLIIAEKRLGTVLYLYEMLFKCAISEVLRLNQQHQLLYIVLQVMFGMVGVELPVSYGVWNPAMYFTVYRCLQNPDEDQQILMFPVVIKARFYWPISLIALNFIGFPRVDLLCFVAVAAFEVLVLKHSILRLTKPLIEKIENSRLFNAHQSRQDFILADHANELVFQGVQPIQFFQQQPAVEEQLPAPSPEAKPKSQSDSFEKTGDE